MTQEIRQVSCSPLEIPAVVEINDLNEDVFNEIFSKLNVLELSQSRMICKKWAKLGENPLLLERVLADVIFGKEKWERYFGVISNVPALPIEILKKQFKTHLPFLIPESIDGKPFTLNLFKDLAHAPKGNGFATPISSSKPSKIVDQCSEIVNAKAHWTFLPKPAKWDEKSEELMKQIDNSEPVSMDPIKVPNFLDAVVASVSYHIHFGMKFSLNFVARWRDQFESIEEKEKIKKWHVIVGCFGPNKIRFFCDIQFDDF